jgi:hypothetical protein
MNLYEITLHDTESFYLLAPTKYRALELVGDYLADAGSPNMMESGRCGVMVGVKPRWMKEGREFAPAG